MNYCPTCWPADPNEHENGRCLVCRSVIIAATPEKEIELLREQNEALQLALRQAMQALGDNRSGELRRPYLRLV